ncbi:type I restriction endonuclease [uncultured Draconibacterium sp.]|uniref:type I restriction endonuclease n=1 Tax=uncultured Draconibacterium sp. TaxID=1573823 RepID=UPI0029C6C2BB|nr:type I restriction endonuclease [uncultured Draconibacterium sp.]
MEMQTQLKALQERIATLKDNIQTEEATKNAFILPFIQLLGYDVFNPLEVIPEFISDVGIKKGEKVDFAIAKDSVPIIIIECKHWKENLNLHDTQLQRYFNVSKAKFGILTNGIQYRFYTDLEKPNIMDTEPFLLFDFENYKEHSVNELCKFHKSAFDVDKITNTASLLKYSTAFKQLFQQELNEPSEEFVKFFAKQIYTGRLTEKVLEQFNDIVKKSLQQSLKDIVSDRLTSALKKEEDTAVQSEPEESEEEESKIVTTEEEIEGFHIVKSILRESVDISRIYARDTQSYFGVLLDDNNRKPLCRLHLNGGKKYLGIFDSNKKESRVQLEVMDDIYKYAQQLKDTIGYYE